MQIVDLGAGGALLEAARPLRPGADVEVQVERGDRRVRVSARVLRCSVTAIDAHHGLTYRAAVAFSEPLDGFSVDSAREDATRDGHGLPDEHAHRRRSGSHAHK